MRRHHEYLEERIKQLREGLLRRKVGSISPNKPSSYRYTNQTASRYDSPERFNRFDSYRLKTEGARFENVARMTRAT